MAATFKEIACEAIAQTQRLEGVIKALQAQNEALRKTAAQASLVQSVVQGLCKCGCLLPQEKAQASDLLSKDINASLRAIQGLCQVIPNANNIIKQASQDLNCGELVSQTNQANTNVGSIGDAAWAAVRRVLASR